VLVVPRAEKVTREEKWKILQGILERRPQISCCRQELSQGQADVLTPARMH